MPARYLTPFTRRNLLRNTEWRGAVAGNPAQSPGDNGVLPTDVAMIEDPPLPGNNIDFTNQGVVDDAGLRRLDLAFTTLPGGAANAGNVAITLGDFSNPALRSIRPGDSYTFSVFARLTSQPGQLAGMAVQVNEYNEAGQFQDYTFADIFPVIGPLRGQRWAVSAQIKAAGTTRIRPIIGLYYELGQTFDFGLGIAVPQLERAVRASAPQRRFI